MRRQIVITVAVVAVLSLASCSSDRDEPTPPDRGTAAPSATTGEQGAVDESAVDAYLAQIADMYGIVNPPEVERVRVVSIQDQASVVAACLQDQGFNATANADGSWEVETTSAQATSLDMAEYTCVAQYPLDPEQTRPLTSDQKDVVADYLLVTLVQCLEAEGHPVDDVPSRETFLAGYTDSPPWNPYNELLPVLSNAELATLEAACPINTPPDLLYGQ